MKVRAQEALGARTTVPVQKALGARVESEVGVA
jgi:hypothetical protein